MRKLKHREVKPLAQDYNGRAPDLHPGIRTKGKYMAIKYNFMTKSRNLYLKRILATPLSVTRTHYSPSFFYSHLFFLSLL